MLNLNNSVDPKLSTLISEAYSTFIIDHLFIDRVRHGLTSTKLTLQFTVENYFTYSLMEQLTLVLASVTPSFELVKPNGLAVILNIALVENIGGNEIQVTFNLVATSFDKNQTQVKLNDRLSFVRLSQDLVVGKSTDGGAVLKSYFGRNTPVQFKASKHANSHSGWKGRRNG